MGVGYPPPKDVFVGEGTFPTSLPLKLLVALQEKTGVGPLVLLKRIYAHEWEALDIPEVIRLGLIGGGMSDRAALALVETYVHGAYLDYEPIAATILLNALQRPKEDATVGEPQAPTKEPSTQQDASDGPMSSGSPEPPEGHSPT